MRPQFQVTQRHQTVQTHPNYTTWLSMNNSKHPKLLKQYQTKPDEPQGLLGLIERFPSSSYTKLRIQKKPSSCMKRHYFMQRLYLLREGLKKKNSYKAVRLTASILWKCWPILAFIKWQNNPKYDNLSRIFHIFLTASGEGGSTQAVSLTAL